MIFGGAQHMQSPKHNVRNLLMLMLLMFIYGHGNKVTDC